MEEREQEESAGWIASSDPPEVRSLSTIDHVNVHVTITMIHDVLTAMLEDVGDTSNVASVYEPFQVLLRQVFTAAARYYSDHGSQELARVSQGLLDSGKLDSPSVARAPTPVQVLALIRGEQVTELLSRPPEDIFEAEVQHSLRDQVAVIADAMDCAYKQAIAAPQTVGSRFARKEKE